MAVLRIGYVRTAKETMINISVFPEALQLACCITFM